MPRYVFSHILKFIVSGLLVPQKLDPSPIGVLTMSAHRGRTSCAKNCARGLVVRPRELHSEELSGWSGDLVVWWSGGLVVWWSGGLVVCYAMLCYVMLCYVMLCYVMLCYAMLCCATSCFTTAPFMLCYAMLCYVMLCYVMLCYMLCLCYVNVRLC